MAFRVTQGRFGFGSFRLPDFGISERLFGRGSQISPRGAQRFPVGRGVSTPRARTAAGISRPVATIASRVPFGPIRPPSIAPAPTGGGGTVSGGGTAPTGTVEGTIAPTETTAVDTGPTETELRQQAVQEVFGPQEEFLQNLLAQARGGEEANLATVGGRFTSQIPGLEAARTSLLGGIEQRRGETRRREQTAIGEARRLAQELQQRNIQQFGGGSAGGFAREFQGRELQRGLGGIRQTTTGNLQQLAQQAQDVEANFQSALQQLEADKQSALQQARDRFQDRINQIQQQQGLLGGEKAAALADVARELRADQFNIEQGDREFRQGIIDQFTQVALQLQSAQQQSLLEAGQPIDLATLQGAVLPTIQGFQQALAPAGQLQGQIRREEEPLTALQQAAA